MGIAALRTMLVVGLSISTARAQIINVSGGGTALQLAVQAAPTGATLVCAPGAYDSFVINGKRLTIVAPLRATIMGTVYSPTNSVNTALHLVDFDFASPSFYDYGGVSLYGDLIIEGCTGVGIAVRGTSNNRSTVIVTNCTFDATGWYSGAGLTNTDAVAIDSTFIGGNSDPMGPTNYPVGAVALQSSSLRAQNCTMQGGGSWNGPGYGISLESLAFVGPPSKAWLAECDVRAAPAQPPFAHEAARISQLSTLSHDASCTFFGQIHGSSTLDPLARCRWVVRNWSLGGGSVIEFQHEPNAIAAVVLSWAPEPGLAGLTPEPLFFGSSSNWVLWTWGVADQNGLLPTAITLPPLPALQYQPLFATAVFVEATPWRSTVPIGGIVR